MKLRIVPHLALVAIATTMVGCNRSEAPSGGKTGVEPVTIRVGYRVQAILDVTPVIIEQAKLRDDSIRVALIPISSPQDGLAKFDAGELDAIAGMPLEALVSRMSDSSSARLLSVYALQADDVERGSVAVAVGTGVSATSIAQLANVVVASLPTEQGEYLLRRVLIAAGVSSARVKTTRYSAQAPLAGLQSGEHGAIFGPEPATARAQRAGFRIIERGLLARYLAGGRPFPVSASVIRNDFATKHPAAVRRFQSIIDSALTILDSDPQRVRGFFRAAAYGGLDSATAELLVFPLMRRQDPVMFAVADSLFGDLLRDGLIKVRPKMNAVALPMP